MSNALATDAIHSMSTNDSSRRAFLKQAGALALSTSGLALLPGSSLAAPAKNPPETLVKLLHDTLTAEQKKQVCFAWDHVDKKRGLLRTRPQYRDIVQARRKARFGS